MVNVVCYLLWRLGTLTVFPAYCFFRGRSSPPKGVWRENRNHLGSPYLWMLGTEMLSVWGLFRAPGTLGAVCLMFLHLGKIAVSRIALCRWLPLLHLISPASWRHSEPFFVLCGTILFPFESVVFYAQILEMWCGISLLMITSRWPISAAGDGVLWQGMVYYGESRKCWSLCVCRSLFDFPSRTISFSCLLSFQLISYMCQNYLLLWHLFKEFCIGLTMTETLGSLGELRSYLKDDSGNIYWVLCVNHCAKHVTFIN